MKKAADNHEKNPELLKAAFGDNYATHIKTIQETVDNLHTKDAKVRLDVPPGQGGGETPFTKVGDEWKPGPIIFDNEFHQKGEFISCSYRNVLTCQLQIDKEHQAATIIHEATHALSNTGKC